MKSIKILFAFTALLLVSTFATSCKKEKQPTPAPAVVTTPPPSSTSYPVTVVLTKLPSDFQSVYLEDDSAHIVIQTTTPVVNMSDLCSDPSATLNVPKRLIQYAVKALKTDNSTYLVGYINFDGTGTSAALGSVADIPMDVYNLVVSACPGPYKLVISM